jgi:hypothetical protein
MTSSCDPQKRESLPAKMILTLGDVSLTHEIDDEIELG